MGDRGTKIVAWFIALVLTAICWGVISVQVFHCTEPFYTGPLSFIVGVIVGAILWYVIVSR